MYKYIRNNVEWILQQLLVSEVDVNEFQQLPGQKIEEVKPTLLKLMFHIGNQVFDQLLTGSLRVDYNSWLQTPISMTMERAWLQISQRCDFQENAKLSIHEAVMVAFVQSQLKQ